MTTPPYSDQQACELIDFVAKLKDNSERGDLAKLRGALADSTVRQMPAWPILARFGGIPTENQHKPEVVRTVAGLLAMSGFKHAKGAKNFGFACRRLLADDERKSLYKPEQTGPVARRVQHLLTATREEICPRVCQLARRIENEGATIDFEQLYTDLLYWSDKVKARWAQQFWGGPEQEETQQQSNPEAQNE